jgi:hypothetical protein
MFRRSWCCLAFAVFLITEGLLAPQIAAAATRLVVFEGFYRLT